MNVKNIFQNQAQTQGLLGFKKGGIVPGKRGKGRVAVVHGGEVGIPNTLPGLQREALRRINHKTNR